MAEPGSHRDMMHSLVAEPSSQAKEMEHLRFKGKGAETRYLYSFAQKVAAEFVYVNCNFATIKHLTSHLTSPIQRPKGPKPQWATREPPRSPPLSYKTPYLKGS